MKHLVQPTLFIFLTMISIGRAEAQSFGKQCENYTRPVPVGSCVANNQLWFGTSRTQQTPNNQPTANCAFIGEEAGTLGAVVQDQNGNQYILSAAHAIALAESINVPSGYFASGSNTPITQPSAAEQGAGLRLTTCAAYASLVSPPSLSSIQVGSLGIVVPPDFTKGVVIPAEVALAPVESGTVSPNILGISAFSGTPMTVVKKGLQVQKSGERTGLTFGTVKKIKMMYPVGFCSQAPNGTGKCPEKNTTLLNAFEIKGNGGNFAGIGDSGALVLTNPAAGMCPQPVAMLEAESTTGGTKAIAAPISGPSPEGVLQLLDFASGTNTYSIVPSTTSCTSTNMAYVTDTTSGVTALEDITVPDPDVAAAIAVLPGFEQSLPGCAYLSLCYGGFCDPGVQSVGIDLSGKVAALDVEVTNLDSNNQCIPATYGGVPVEQEVVDTEYGDTGDISVVSF